LRAHAFGALYLRSALFNFELGEVERGAALIAKAAQTAPGFAQDERGFAQRVADEAFRIAGDRGALAAGVEFVETIFARLPSTAQPLGAGRSRALAALYAAEMFAQFDRGNRPATWGNAVRAVWHHPGLACDRGVLSVTAQALLGGKPWARWRRSRGAVART